MNDEASVQPNSITIDPWVWFHQRQLKHLPKHFTVCKTSVTAESLYWIRDNLKGRYTFVYDSAPLTPTQFYTFAINDFFPYCLPAFEDSSEAILYELTWS